MKINSHMTPHSNLRKLASGIAILGLITGCAGVAPPTEQMAVSKAAVNSAMSAGGNEFAPVQIRAAMDKMDSAERAMLTEEYVQARQLAEQAMVDAKLAAATARAAKAQKAVSALQEGNRALRQELNRKAP